MAKTKPRIPSGFPEYLPAEQLEFNRLLTIIRDTYERYGFSPIDTPDLELSEVLLTKSGGDTEKQVYRFKKGDHDLTMRFDLTVPLARYVAQHEGQLVFPFRRYQIGKVHRGERAQAGRFREFYQCDIDSIGSESPLVDAEFPAIINEIFERFDFGEFTIHINNRMILNGFFEELGLSGAADDVLRIVDKIEKMSQDDFVRELHDTGLDDQKTDAVLAFMRMTGSTDEIITQLRGMNVASSTFRDGVEKMSQLVAALRAMGVPDSRFVIDTSIARGLDYYTGTVYETTLNDHPEIGSVCSGGRYDNLASHYTNTPLPGIGISIGLSRLFYKLCELNIIKPKKVSPANVVVMPLSDEQIPAGLAVAKVLREAGNAVVTYTEPNAVKKKMRYADRMGFEWVALIGDREVAAQEVSLKNMKTGESRMVPAGDVVAAVAAVQPADR